MSNPPVNGPLKDLTKRLIEVCIAFGACLCLLFVLREQLLTFWIHPATTALPDDITLPGAVLQPSTMASSVKLALLSTLFPVLPFVLYQMWRALENGAIKKKTHETVPFLIWTSGTFFFGAALCYLIVMPHVARASITVSADETSITRVATNFLPLAAKSTFAFGLAFALPVVFYFLGRKGLISYRHLARKRRFAMTAMFVAAALFTPPDLVTLWMMGILLAIICELCLQAVHLAERKRPKEVSSASFSEPDSLGTRSRWMLAFFALVILGIAFLDGFPKIGLAEILFIIVLPFIFESLYVLYIAFRNSVIQGLLCLFIPFYAPWFAFRKSGEFFNGRFFTKIWAPCACLATLYGILHTAGIA